MIISIINHSHGKVSDAEVLRIIRAINRQVQEDFAPYWSMSATLRLEGHSDHKTGKPNAADMRGDAVIYLWDKADTDEAASSTKIFPPSTKTRPTKKWAK